MTLCSDLLLKKYTYRKEKKLARWVQQLDFLKNIFFEISLNLKWLYCLQ